MNLWGMCKLIEIIRIADKDLKEQIALKVLESLPEWFGLLNFQFV